MLSALDMATQFKLEIYADSHNQEYRNESDCDAQGSNEQCSDWILQPGERVCIGLKKPAKGEQNHYKEPYSLWRLRKEAGFENNEY